MARQMKDSGIPYLGTIPASWGVQKLRYSVRWKSEKGYPDAEVLALYRDYGVIPKSSRDDNHNVTSLDTSTYKYVEVGDFVINKMKAWQGSMGVSPYSGIISPAYHVCAITNEDIHRPYFHYLLRNVAYLPEFARLSTGLRIGQWDLSFDDFRNLPFLLPDKPEQERIAAILDTKCAEIDKVVEQTRATIEEYKKLKQAIITEAVTKGVRGPRPMKPSGVEWIGDIPEEWEVKRIKYVLNNHDALRRPIAAENRSQKGDILYDYYGASGVIDQIDDYIIEGTYILIGEDGANLVLRNLPLVYVAKGKYWVNNHAHILSPKQGIEFDYIIHALESADYTTFITGTAQPKLSQGNLSQVSLPVPTAEEQLEIASYLDTKCAEINRIIEKKEQLIEELGSYKKSLIYEYVTGKKEVKTNMELKVPYSN